MDIETQVQNLDEAVCISQCTNTLGKSIIPTVLPPAMAIKQGSLDSLTFVWQPVEENEN